MNVWRLLRPVIESFAVAAGVAVAIAALAVSHSVSTLSNKPVNGQSPDVVVVSGAPPASAGIELGLPSTSLTTDDVVALGNPGTVPDSLSLAPTAGVHIGVQALGRTTPTNVIGSTDGFAQTLGYQLASGRSITSGDVQTAAPVAVLGQTVVNSLFAGTDPVGQSVTINNHTFQVVGVFQPRGYSGSYDQDNLVVVPITTAWRLLLPAQKQPIDQVLIRAATPSAAKTVAQAATATLLQRHAIVNPSEADFTVQTQAQVVHNQVEATRGMQRVLELAAVLLLIAGTASLALLARSGSLQDWFKQIRGSWFSPVANLLSRGLVGAFIGVDAAFLLAPALHRWSTGAPAFHVSGYGVIAGAGLGVGAALIASVAALIGPITRRPGAVVNANASPPEQRVPVVTGGSRH